jgi:hypothetical protein
MDIEENLTPSLLGARIANVEYTQTPVSRTLLDDLGQIIELTQPVFAKKELVRLGQNADGGYVLSPDFESKLCLNLGVGYEVTTDLDLIDRGFELFAFDGTVPNPLTDQINYHFTQKNIGYQRDNDSLTNLEKIFKDYPKLSQVDLILIDIEGHEYEVLKKELPFVTKAKQVVIEFHGLELLGDREFSAGFIQILNKFSKTHSPIHIHGNNSGGSLLLGGGSWPTILEVTFLKREYCTSEINYGPFPTVLDFPNVDIRPDLDLSPFYGVDKNYASLARTVLGSK